MLFSMPFLIEFNFYTADFLNTKIIFLGTCLGDPRQIYTAV